MPLAIYPWQEALSRDLEIFRHRMPSGIIVSGPRDIGTFELVLAFTKSLMCENPAEDGTPCGKCPGCRLAEAGTHPDIRFLLSEEEAARHDLPIPESAGKKLSDEISIAAVRELRDYVALKPHRSPRRVILISPADRIRPDAASVLLKMVEEPPPDLSFIMIAEDLDAILPTLRSRCVLLHARKPDPEAASSWLESKGLKDFDEQLAEAGGNPLAVVRGHTPATSAEEYPALPKKEEENKITISHPVLKDMINQTKFAVAVTDLKPVLKGELFEIENGTLTLVALDGYRLAVRYEPIKYDGSLKFVVPAKTLSEIAALLGDNDEETASVYLSKNHVVFELNGYLVYSRLIEGEFHPYKSAIPTTCTTEVIVDRKELIAALERSLILISDRTPSPARCYFENNSIKINCSTSVGKITDEIKADIAGPVIEIGFKCKYLLDPLKVIKEDKVKLQMSGSLLPMKIVPCEGDAYTYLVLPVRLAKE